jgi:hypothetical protein
VGICKTCGKNADSEYCFAHKSRKPLPSSGRGLTSKMSVISNKKFNNVQNNERFTEMRDFFLSIWKKRSHKSEVSGVYLGKEPMSTYFHHILPKEKYPEACLDEENIILLTLEEHSNVENDMYRYEEVNIRRNLLKLKYEH